MEHTQFDHDRLTELLASPLSSEEPVVSLYLGASQDGDRKLVLKNLEKQGQLAVERDTGFDDERRKNALVALGRAHGAAADALARGTPKGSFVAFAWADKAETFRVPLALRDRIVVGRTPYTSPLTVLLQQYEHFGVAVVDHRKGRIFDYFVNTLTHLEDAADVADKHVRSAGYMGLEQARMNHHRDYSLHRHLQHVADRIFAQHKRRAFDRLVLAGTGENIAKLEPLLHPYLRGRVVAREKWDHDVPPDEVRKKTMEIELTVEIEKEKRLLAVVRDHVCGDLLATTGYDETLRALYYGKVATLIIEDGLVRVGRECPECRFLFPREEDKKEKTPVLVPCPLCSRPTRSVPDVIDEAVELAVLSGVKVEHIVHAKDELAGLGHMAAILRFR
jgi:peptide subunit release factor 1 (eRF1)